jgi:hypothetical protein
VWWTEKREEQWSFVVQEQGREEGDEREVEDEGTHARGE